MGRELCPREGVRGQDHVGTKTAPNKQHQYYLGWHPLITELLSTESLASPSGPPLSNVALVSGAFPPEAQSSRGHCHLPCILSCSVSTLALWLPLPKNPLQSQLFVSIWAPVTCLGFLSGSQVRSRVHKVCQVSGGKSCKLGK